jgi:hypothetical protein
MPIDPVELRVGNRRPSRSRVDRFLKHLDALLFTTDFKQRVTLRVLALTAMVYATCIALLYYGAVNGIFESEPVIWLALACVVHVAGFYTAVRSGWNQRRADPTLAFAQTVVSQTLIAAGYAITGPAHAASLLILALVMVFGMFNMRVLAVRIVAAYTILLMGAIMLWKSQIGRAHV